jgi:hypothetical protein
MFKKLLFRNTNRYNDLTSKCMVCSCMKVLLDGLMAVNKIGTGRYVEEMCRRLQKEETR